MKLEAIKKEDPSSKLPQAPPKDKEMESIEERRKRLLAQREALLKKKKQEREKELNLYKQQVQTPSKTPQIQFDKVRI